MLTPRVMDSRPVSGYGVTFLRGSDEWDVRPSSKTDLPTKLIQAHRLTDGLHGDIIYDIILAKYCRIHKPRVPNRKLLGRLKNSQRNVSYRELRSLLESYGFVLTR